MKHSAVAAMLACMLVGGDALAQRGERGGGDRGRSSSGGDRGGSSRSFSRGGGDRGGPSFSRGSSDRGSSSRSFSRGSSERGTPSFSRGSSESRSMRGSQRSTPSFSRGDRSQRSSVDRSFDRGSRAGDSVRTDQFRSRSGESIRDTTRDRQSYRGDRGQVGERGRFGDRQQYETRRPSEQQVRDFLGDERGDRSARRDDDQRRGSFSQRSRESQRDTDRDRDDRDRFRDRGDRDRGDVADSRDWRDDRRRGDWDDDDRRGRRDGDRDRWGDRDDWVRRGDWDNRDWSGRRRNGDRFRYSDRIRDRWRDWDWDRNRYLPFYGGWWGNARWYGRPWGFWNDYAYRYDRPFYWWTWTTAPRLSSWVTYSWPNQYYWDYGRGEYIYYDDGAIYVNGRWYQPAPVFYENTVRLVEEVPDLSEQEAAQLEWLPLGVFAVTPEGDAEPDVLVQIAVTKDGILGGTAFDQQSNAAFPVEGQVDKDTQRAVWSYTDQRDRRVVMETSIYNLTQPEATGLVYFNPNEIEVIELVRLEEPESVPQTARR